MFLSVSSLQDISKYEDELREDSSKEIVNLMNGTVLTYIRKNLRSTASRFFLSSFTNWYINNPVIHGHYSTFSDVLDDFTANLSCLVASLLSDFSDQLKVEAAFLADNSIEQITNQLHNVLEAWIDTWFLKLNKAGLQAEMDAACDQEFDNVICALGKSVQTPQEIIQNMLKQIMTRMAVVFSQKWKQQMEDPTAKASFEESYHSMVRVLAKQLSDDAPSIQEALNISVPLAPPPIPAIPGSIETTVPVPPPVPSSAAPKVRIPPPVPAIPGSQDSGVPLPPPVPSSTVPQVPLPPPVPAMPRLPEVPKTRPVPAMPRLPEVPKTRPFPAQSRPVPVAENERSNVAENEHSGATGSDSPSSANGYTMRILQSRVPSGSAPALPRPNQTPALSRPHPTEHLARPLFS